MKKTIKKNKKSKKISKFIGKGSFGCVFKPNIPCKKDKKKKISNKNVSKILIKSKNKTKNINNEFKITKMIRKIPNYKEWAYVWDKKCKAPSYTKIKNISEIDICLKKINKNKNDYDNNNIMFIGEYGGITLTEYVSKLFFKETFLNKQKFINSFLKLFKSIGTIFKGVYELDKRKISHMDINRSNIVVNNDKCFLIDFGMASKYNNKKIIRKRSISQFESTRIYSPYPLDFIYAFVSLKDKEKEISSFEKGIFREKYKQYSYIHKHIFDRKKIYKDIFVCLTTNNNKSKIIENLDVYSLGFLIPYIIFDSSKKHKIKKKIIKELMHLQEIKNHMKLLKSMTEFFSKDRISIISSYQKYKNLI